MKLSTALSALALGLLLGACDDDDTTRAEKRLPAATDAGVTAATDAVDPSLAKAVEAMAEAPPSSDASGGPPASGVLTAGQADAELPAGASVKVVVGSTGNAPRETLARQPGDGAKWPATLRLRLGSGATGVPPLELTLELQPTPAPVRAPGSDAGSQVPDVAVSAKIIGIQGAAEMGVPLPERIQSELKKLEGSKLGFLVSPTGGAHGFEAKLSEAAGRELMDVLDGVKNALSLILVAMPQEPIGAGGYFMVTSRDQEAGTDVITYRMVRVQSVQDGKAALEMTTRRYAASNRVQLAAGEVLDLVTYESQGEARLDLDLKAPFPESAQVSHDLRAQLTSSQRPGQQLRMETRIQGRFALKGAGASPAAR